MTEQQEKIVCNYCGKDTFENSNQLRGHQMTCRPKEDTKAKTVEAEKTTTQRKERIPFGARTKRFNAPENDGFMYRVFNDNWRLEPGRIQRALAAGYEFIPEDNQSGRSVGTNDDGSEIKGVLMRIPKEIYDEDQKVKQKEIDKVDEQIHRGKFMEKPGDNRYIPASGIKIESKFTP